MSKGSRPRPFAVDRSKFNDNWDKIFNKGKNVDAEKWKHQCKHNGETFLEKGIECSWCGEKEND